MLKENSHPEQTGINKDDYTSVYSSILANTALSLSKINSNTDCAKVLEVYGKKFNKFFDGNTVSVEALLLSQAYALDAFFHDTLRKAATSEYLIHAQANSDMAFKAQKCCRQTITALMNIKQPKNTTFVKQQNNAINQQINHSEKNQKNPANELLSEVKHETLDNGRAFETVAINSAMETVGKVDRG